MNQDIHFKGPNILICGTPGTGKSTLASELSDLTSLTYVNISKLVKENEFHTGYDQELECHILDEDRLIDEIDEQMKEGGNIVDYHGCDFFPERWFDVIFVLRTDNNILYQRLEKRNYNIRKIQENVQCEIFQTILDEAKDSYRNDIVFELTSNSPDDLHENLQKIEFWINNWKKNSQLSINYNSSS